MCIQCNVNTYNVNKIRACYSKRYSTCYSTCPEHADYVDRTIVDPSGQSIKSRHRVLLQPVDPKNDYAI